MGMIGGMQVGFEVLGDACRWWGAGCVGQIMLNAAMWFPHTTLPVCCAFVYVYTALTKTLLLWGWG